MEMRQPASNVIPFPVRPDAVGRVRSGAGGAPLRQECFDPALIKRWLAVARSSGVDRVELCDDASEHDDGSEYVLIYLTGRQWSSWGIASAGPRFRVWQCATGADLGDFPSMREALDGVLAFAANAERAASRPRTVRKRRAG